jgi:hypothetical protein
MLLVVGHLDMRRTRLCTWIKCAVSEELVAWPCCQAHTYTTLAVLYFRVMPPALALLRLPIKPSAGPMPFRCTDAQMRSRSTAIACPRIHSLANSSTHSLAHSLLFHHPLANPSTTATKTAKPTTTTTPTPPLTLSLARSLTKPRTHSSHRRSWLWG